MPTTSLPYTENVYRINQCLLQVNTKPSEWVLSSTSKHFIYTLKHKVNPFPLQKLDKCTYLLPFEVLDIFFKLFIFCLISFPKLLKDLVHEQNKMALFTNVFNNLWKKAIVSLFWGDLPLNTATFSILEASWLIAFGVGQTWILSTVLPLKSSMTSRKSHAILKYLFIHIAFLQ